MCTGKGYTYSITFDVHFWDSDYPVAYQDFVGVFTEMNIIK